MSERINKLLYNRRFIAYLFVAPFFLIAFIFFFFPLLNSFIMSFQEVDFGERTFIGLENYKSLINPTFGIAIKNSTIYMLLTLVVLIPLPLLLSVMINDKNLKGTTIFKSVLFLPALTSAVVISIVFKFMFGELEYSEMNIIISYFGHGPIKWLSDPRFVFPILVTLATWRWIGINMLYFISGLKNIPDEVYEAAAIDGASKTRTLFFITIPMLKPVTIYVLTISIYAGLAMFTESYLVYGLNSPENMSLTIVGYLYKIGIQQNDLGLASAIGIFLLVFAFLINLIQLKVTGFFKE